MTKTPAQPITAIQTQGVKVLLSTATTTTTAHWILAVLLPDASILQTFVLTTTNAQLIPVTPRPVTAYTQYSRAMMATHVLSITATLASVIALMTTGPTAHHWFHAAQVRATRQPVHAISTTPHARSAPAAIVRVTTTHVLTTCALLTSMSASTIPRPA